MTVKPSLSEYLVISRGQWDSRLSQDEIQEAIDKFYAWKERLTDEGKMRSGERLAPEGKTVSRSMITDGPFSETKEVIGGYWFILAGSLEEAANIAAQNPCLACGLFCEIRPIDPTRASAFKLMTETPGKQTGKQ
jgi:hypothetical protein